MEVILNKSTNNILVVDGDYLAHRAFYAFSRPGNMLMTKTGKYSGCFYGFFSILLERIATYGIAEVLVCWGDTRENLFRRDIYVAYKEGRHSMPEYYREQEQDIKKALFCMGFKQYVAEKYEGDDVIAAVVSHTLYLLKSQYADKAADVKKIMILSGDKDMFQLISNKVFVIGGSSTTSGDIVYTCEKVFEKFGVVPELFSDYLTLVGDSTDNVPGVRGIGPKNAAFLLNTYGPIKMWFNGIEYLDISDKQKRLLLDGRESMVLSKKLVNLKNKTYLTVPFIPLDYTFQNMVTPEYFFDKYEMSKIRPHSFLSL